MNDNCKFNKFKLKRTLFKNRSKIRVLKIVFIFVLMVIMNINKIVINIMYFGLLFEIVFLNNKHLKFNKYILNITFITMLLIERLLFLEKYFNNLNLMLTIIFLSLIILIIKIDFVANRMMKYNFSIFDHELKINISKSKMLNMFKTIIILTIIISLRINIIIITVVMLFLFKQICLKEDQLDKTNNTAIDLAVLLIISLSILFKSDSIKIVENTDLAMILLIGTIIAINWMIDNKK
jgi:membrane protein